MALSPTSSHGGGSSAFVGAEIYLGTATLIFPATGSQQVLLTTVQFDTSGIADLPNNQLVIPAGKGGYWTYGFTIDLAPTDVTVTVNATLSVAGAAFNLSSASVNDPQLTLGAEGIDVFSEGDSLSLNVNVGAAVNLAVSGNPARLFVHYLGT